MSLYKAACRSGLIGTLLSLICVTFLASKSPAQDQICECHDTYSTVAVRYVPVRRSVRKYRKVNRTTVAHRVVRPVYRTVYVPVREVVSSPTYVAHVDDDCDDVEYTRTRHVVVTERVYPVARTVTYTNGYARKAYYPNGYNGNGAYVSNSYKTTGVYLNGSYSELEVDPDYFSTARIASD